MKVLVTGGSGMLGRSIVSELENRRIEFTAPARSELDLFDGPAVKSYISGYEPTHIVHAAAMVGGIEANMKAPVEFLSQNLRTDLNLFEAALDIRIPNLLYMSSSCIYPVSSDNPKTEDMVLTGKPEITNIGYALSKIIGMQYLTSVAMSQSLAWRTLILSNMYGPGDHFNTTKSHLLASIISKVGDAIENGDNEIVMWGEGLARREFTFVEDVAKFIGSNLGNIVIFPQNMNLGYGEDYSVKEYYERVLNSFGVEMRVKPDLSKPVGIMQKLMDSSRAKDFGWSNLTGLEEGLKKTVDWYKSYLTNSSKDSRGAAND